jgi:hypothetical protein
MVSFTSLDVSWWSFAVVGAVLLGLSWISSTCIQYRKLQHIKGPWLAAVSPLWMFYYTWHGKLYQAVEDALRKYGEQVT